MEEKMNERKENELEIKDAVAQLSNDEISKMMFSEPEPPLKADDMADDDEIPSGGSITASNAELGEQPIKYPTPDRSSHVSGKRKFINYGGESSAEKLERTYRAFEAAKYNHKILEGTIVGSKVVQLPNDMVDILFEILPTDPVYNNIPVYIIGEKMTKILEWDRQEDSKERTRSTRRRFSKGMLHAEIQFCIENITITNPEEPDIENREYFIAGNRLMANNLIREMYFNPMDPEQIQEGDIVNGRVIAVFANRIVYTFAGIDMYLYITVPYITGVSRIIPGTSGKTLVQINEDKECLINRIQRDPETQEITNINISFYAPLKEKIMKKIDSLTVNAMYTGTIMRFLPPNDERKRAYMIVKTDTGIEVLCVLPNWKKPPMELDSVKVKIIDIRPNGESTLVLGFIKR